MLNSYFNETSVIGSLLISPEVLEIVEAILTPADFEDDVCRDAYLAALSLRDDKKQIDALLLGNELKKRTGENMTGWLVEAMQITPTAANVESYCQLVKEDANKRRLSRIAEAINENTGSGSRAGWRETASEALEQIGEIEGSAGSDIVSSLDMANGWMEYYEKVVKNPDFAFCRTGYATLDRMFGGGMFRQGVYIVGARPGMGKTTLGINIAENIAKRDSNVLFVSMEMSRTQIMAKRISIVGGISYTKLMNGSLANAALKEAIETASKLSERPFSLVDRSRMTVVDIGRAARQVKNVSAIVVDYLGLVRPEEVKSNKPRYEEMTDISADLKALAKLLGIPIIVLCQLNRENASTSDKRPQLQHLRDSGAIEQDADCVVLLHRPEYYNAERLKDEYAPPALEDIELIVAKNRHGETGLVKLSWRGATGEIKEFDTTHIEPFGR